MAKFSPVLSEDIKRIVDEIAEERGLNHYMEFEPIHFAKGKEVVSVCRANATAEYLSKREDLVLILVREDAFDRVDEKTKYLWLRMAMDQVSFDSEKDKIIIGTPSITVPIGFYDKFKEIGVNAALLGRYTLDQIEDEEKQRKESEKANKKKKKGKEE